MKEDLTKLTKEQLIEKLLITRGAFNIEVARRLEMEKKISKLRDALVDVLSTEFVSRGEIL